MASGTSTPELWRRSARALHETFVRGEASALEIVDAHLARVASVDGRLNAVVVRRESAAREEAREQDRRRAAGAPLGPLAGVPVMIKECLDLAGTPSTFGLPSRARTLADTDEAHVRRWRDAGAIVLGKTNVAQLLAYLESDNPLYGRTNHPDDGERSPGGSSGGQAAIIAAGGVPLGLGTDIGGSNRTPAAFCGIVGFKPSTGRLPDSGRYSFPAGQQAIPSQVGVFARCVGDVGLGVRVADGSDRPLGDAAAVDVTRLRVGWYDHDDVLTAAPAARRAVAEAAAALAARGVQVSRFTPPEPARAHELFNAVLAADGLAGLKRARGGDKRDRRVALIETGASASRPALALFAVLLRLSGRGKLAATLRTYGRHRRTEDYWRLLEELDVYRARWRVALDGAPGGPLDAILSPASALPAIRHGASAELGLIGAYACVYNLLGYPAGVVPVTRVRAGEESDRAPSRDKLDVVARDCERGSAGLPICVQVAARPWQDHVALAVMEAIEAASG